MIHEIYAKVGYQIITPRYTYILFNFSNRTKLITLYLIEVYGSPLYSGVVVRSFENNDRIGKVFVEFNVIHIRCYDVQANFR